MAKESHEDQEKDLHISSVHEGYGIDDFMSAANSKRRQSLQGFDEDYVDIVDYIIRITHKIWEEKSIGLIYSHYKQNVVIHTSDGITYGREAVVENTLKAVAAFPDVRLVGDDVIWSGNDKDGFHSSHRITWIGHNTGHSIYGPPTGRKMIRQGIVHTFVHRNKIVEEWIVRDELALIRQLGFDELELARKFAASQQSQGEPDLPLYGETPRLDGQLQLEALSLPKDTADVEALVRTAIHEIWNRRMLNRIKDFYVENYHARVSTDRNLKGLGDFQAYILGIMAAFPDLTVTVDHICWQGNEEEGYRVATRWILQGTHSGPGYGEPSGRRVNLWGISHHQVKNGRFVREWTVFDEFALLKQIATPDLRSLDEESLLAIPEDE